MKSIEFPENTGVNNIEEFYFYLMNIINMEKTTVLDLSKIKKIDISIAQALMAAQKNALNNNKTLKLKGASAEFKEQLQLSGLFNQPSMPGKI